MFPVHVTALLPQTPTIEVKVFSFLILFRTFRNLTSFVKKKNKILKAASSSYLKNKRTS